MTNANQARNDGIGQARNGEIKKGTGFAEQAFLHQFNLPFGHRRVLDVLFHRCKSFCFATNLGKTIRRAMDSAVVLGRFLCFLRFFAFFFSSSSQINVQVAPQYTYFDQIW